jgi:hypothetical protein
MQLLRSFDYRLVRELGELHRRITAPVLLVWGGERPLLSGAVGGPRAADAVTTVVGGSRPPLGGRGLISWGIANLCVCVVSTTRRGVNCIRSSGVAVNRLLPSARGATPAAATCECST